MKRLQIYFIFIIAFFLFGSLSCGPDITDSDWSLFYYIYVTNYSTNSISFIHMKMTAYNSNSLGWEIFSMPRWDQYENIGETFFVGPTTSANVFSGYTSSAYENEIAEEGSVLGIVANSAVTNYFISFQKVIAQTLFPELINDARIYGFAYQYIDGDQPDQTKYYFSSDYRPNLSKTNVQMADYTVLISNNSLTLYINFYGWTKTNETDDYNNHNIIFVTNFDY